MELVKQAYLKGERALFKSHDLKLKIVFLLMENRL